MFGCFSSFLCVLSCWRLIARRYWRANNMQCGTLKINPVLEQSKLLAMKMRLSQCASTEQIWNQASLMFTLNIRMMRKRTEGGETTKIAQEWVRIRRIRSLYRIQVISIVRDELYVEQSISLVSINKVTCFCGKSNVQGLRTWFLVCNFPYGTSSLYNHKSLSFYSIHDEPFLFCNIYLLFQFRHWWFA